MLKPNEINDLAKSRHEQMAATALVVVFVVACASAVFLVAQDKKRVPTDSEQHRGRAESEQIHVEIPYKSEPGSSGVSWETIILACTGVSALNGVLLKYLIRPAIIKEIGSLKTDIERDYFRNPKRDEDLPLSRRDNDHLEAMAKMEHNRLHERINELNAEIKLQGQRFDYEFSKNWRATKRVLRRVDKIDNKGHDVSVEDMNDGDGEE